MKRSRYRLSDAEKDVPLDDQAALIEAQAVRIRELEAALSAPKKTPKNSHTPSSAGHKANAKPVKQAKKKPRPSRPGTSRVLAEDHREGRSKSLSLSANNFGGSGSGAGDISRRRTASSHKTSYFSILKSTSAILPASAGSRSEHIDSRTPIPLKETGTIYVHGHRRPRLYRVISVAGLGKRAVKLRHLCALNIPGGAFLRRRQPGHRSAQFPIR